MPYKNMLYQLPCNNCCKRNICFLQRIPLQRYPEETQKFVIQLPSTIFSFDKSDHRWYADYKLIENQIIAHYDINNCWVQENRHYPLSLTTQKESDRQYIRDKFKHFLDLAAKATEDTDPAASIVFDGIGLVLASDYLEVVHKVLSMMNTLRKNLQMGEHSCPQFSAFN